MSTEFTRVGKHLYRIRNTDGSSAKYGPCEICGGNCDSVYLQSSSREYVLPDGTAGFASVASTFGHKSCLVGIRVNAIGGRSNA